MYFFNTLLLLGSTFALSWGAIARDGGMFICDFGCTILLLLLQLPAVLHSIVAVAIELVKTVSYSHEVAFATKSAMREKTVAVKL